MPFLGSLDNFLVVWINWDGVSEMSLEASVYLSKYVVPCVECDEKPATVYIEIDLGFMTTSIGDRGYCEECGEAELQSVRKAMLEILDSETDTETGGLS